MDIEKKDNIEWVDSPDSKEELDSLAWAIDKKKKLDEESEQEEMKKQEEFERQKERMKSDLDIEWFKFDLEKLKVMVEQWALTKSTYELIKNWEIVQDEQVKEIFEKIDQIENIENIDQILPKGLRVTKEEYISALKSEEYKKALLEKINQALDFLFHSSRADNSFWLDLFSFIYTLFNKNLQIVHDHNIDMKRNLK